MTWFFAHETAVLQTLGVCMNVIGVLLLFRFGMPFRLRATSPHLALRVQTAEERAADKRYDKLGYTGIALIVLGTLIQLVALWLPSPAQPYSFVTLSSTPSNALLRATESTRTATWTQAIVTFLVGFGAIAAAVWQIRRYTKSERDKATIKYIAKFSESTHQVPNNPKMSVSTGLSLASGMAKDPLALVNYKECLTEGKRNKLVPEDQKGFDRYNTAFAVASNYFITASEYARLGIIDRAVFARFFNQQILLTRDALSAVADVEPAYGTILGLPSFLSLIEAACHQ